MKSHYQLTDLEFISQFQKGTLNPELFTHEAHIRLAWIYIENDGLDIAIQKVKTQLINYITALGVLDKYNETVTIAAVKMVFHFWLKSESKTFKDFILEYPRLNTNFKDLLAQHYGINIFKSETAKSSFLEPDLLPFD